jgi:hypothetical protein
MRFFDDFFVTEKQGGIKAEIRPACDLLAGHLDGQCGTAPGCRRMAARNSRGRMQAAP